MKFTHNRRRPKPARHHASGNPQTRVYDSSSTRGKTRGTPHQLVEKYLQFAQDAELSGDRVLRESFLQQAEHYIRIINGTCDAVIDPRRENRTHSMNIAEPVEVLPDASSLSDLGSDAPPGQVEDAKPNNSLAEAVADEPTTPATSPAPTEPSAEELRAKRVAEAQATLAAMAAAHGYTLEEIAAAKPSRKPRANRSKAAAS